MIIVYSAVNTLVTTIAWLLMKTIIPVLPPSPIVILNYITDPIASYMPALNWVIPIDAIITTLTAWLGAIVIYYAYMAILRISKII